MSIAISVLLEDGAKLPSYGTEEAAGADVSAFIQSPISLQPGRSVLIPTGIKMEIPKGYEIQVRPRSGLALKHGVTVLNTPGTIDSDYRGEIRVILINHGTETFIIEPGMRIAQLIVAPILKGEFILAQNIALSTRGEGGFGHTGLN